tara:strand:- start:3421 stop:3720 length:300 start_codon:yes stop_codon:yes gene_type:complete
MLLKGKITKIHDPKKSYNGGYVFQRIDLKLDDGRWAKTDLCPTFRNYRNWKPLIDKGVGTQVQGLRIKGGVRVMTIDADSEVRLYQDPELSIPKPPTLF